MSIDHKAYRFRHNEFQRELAEVLYRALDTEDPGPLGAFIRRFRESLTDPATEAPLSVDWEQEYGPDRDVQQYADLALTRYYDLNENLGLSYGFDALEAYLRSTALAQHAARLICGTLFGPKGRRLDPGRMGTGLLCPEEVASLARLLAGTSWPDVPEPGSEVDSECHYQPESAEEVQDSLEQLKELYRRAAESNAGLLLVDYDDRGVAHL
jgi:hypothetical protein